VTQFRYQHQDGAVRRLSPFCKLAWVLSVMIAALLFEHPLYLAALFLATVPMALMASIGRQWLSLMLLSSLIGLGIMIVNAIVINQGSTVLVEATFSVPTLGVPRITMEAIFFAITMALRLVIIVSAFAVFSFSIHPDDQMLALIQLRIPYKSVLVASLATRFVPALFEDLDRLTAVQQSRGLELARGSLIRRVRNRATVLVPLLANSLERCVQIAEAMEARAFGTGSRRTYFKRLMVTPFDVATIAIGVVPLLWGILVVVSGYGGYDAYANWRIAPPSGSEATWISGLIVISLVLAFSGLLKTRFDLD
jgi:energy-coupling factor transport system permease protein